jgi:uncharacterized protein (TIGR02996 family)
VARAQPLTRKLLPGERERLAAVVAALPDDAPRLVYADWLEERGDRRSRFLRAFVAASRSMNPPTFRGRSGCRKNGSNSSAIDSWNGSPRPISPS